MKIKRQSRFAFTISEWVKCKWKISRYFFTTIILYERNSLLHVWSMEEMVLPEASTLNNFHLILSDCTDCMSSHCVSCLGYDCGYLFLFSFISIALPNKFILFLKIPKIVSSMADRNHLGYFVWFNEHHSDLFSMAICQRATNRAVQRLTNLTRCAKFSWVAPLAKWRPGVQKKIHFSKDVLRGG